MIEPCKVFQICPPPLSQKQIERDEVATHFWQDEIIFELDDNNLINNFPEKKELKEFYENINAILVKLNDNNWVKLFENSDIDSIKNKFFNANSELIFKVIKYT